MSSVVAVICLISACVNGAPAPAAAVTPNARMCAAETPSVVDYSTVNMTERLLHVPPLHQLADVLDAALRQTFAEVEVSVTQCPDLTQPPWGLAARGLGGAPRLVELGGVPYLVPLVRRDRLYSLRALFAAAGRRHGLLLGAGAGPWPHVGTNCEGMVNLCVERDGSVRQRSRVAWVHPVGAPHADATYPVAELPQHETRGALLGNYLLSDGDSGEVLKIVANNRTGDRNYITAIREVVKQHYGDQVIGLGGVFVLRGSAARYHVMPDFSATPLQSDGDVDAWLHYLPAPPPTTNVGTLVTGDLELDLRVQHFHGWGEGVGGHYHYDMEGGRARYEGYFVPAEGVLRVDAPAHSHGFGRD